ncbi:MAG TPA: hypothetical protein VK536_02705 [Candidatus Limnocylindrales bacterium]|nr:hypothetical protein [Candidatus Limnocylindrales bacterium]
MIQTLPKKTTKSKLSKKCKIKLVLLTKEFLQANITRASASAAAFWNNGKTSPNLTASAMNYSRAPVAVYLFLDAKSFKLT